MTYLTLLIRKITSLFRGRNGNRIGVQESALAEAGHVVDSPHFVTFNNSIQQINEELIIIKSKIDDMDRSCKLKHVVKETFSEN